MVMRWAREKMHEEQELEKLAKENTTLKDLVDQLNYTKEQIKVVTTLLKA
jgi:cell division protein FtsB